MSVGGDQILPESLIKCSGTGDQVIPESLIKCFRNLRSNAAGISDHFAPEYTTTTNSTVPRTTAAFGYKSGEHYRSAPKIRIHY